VLEAGELHLQLAFVAGGPLGEDFEDQVGAVVDLDRGAALGEGALEVPDLDRGQGVVEDDIAGIVQAAGGHDLLDLAGPGVGGRIGAVTAAGDHLADHRPGALGEARGLLGAIGRPSLADFQAHEDGAFLRGNAGVRLPGSVQKGPTPAWPARPWKWRACRPSGSRLFLRRTTYWSNDSIWLAA